MDLIEISKKRAMTREEAAQFLHELADSLARHNSVSFLQQGAKLNVRVPDDVTLDFEVDIETDESSIEIEITW